MKILIILSIIFCSFQDTKTEWVTIGYAPRETSDTARWEYGAILLVNDSLFIQFRQGINGEIQRREIKK